MLRGFQFQAAKPCSQIHGENEWWSLANSALIVWTINSEISNKMKTQQLTAVGEAAQKFSKLFYENYDKDRNKLKGFYSENAQLVWNGNAVSSVDGILAFLNGLPSSVTELVCLDAQVRGIRNEGRIYNVYVLYTIE